MFGEFESESPRVPSPWDSPPECNGIPKLVPEADEGNVEYKLQLLSPTPARFARLVTQLKWRLLEGGGQAYYEIGVADSGMLVGLPLHQLEESLETLEMMAGEIGASVIVVKEIEVPLEVSTFAQSQIEKWDGKGNARRKDLLRMADKSPAMSPTELETVSLTTEGTDGEETTSSSPASPPAQPSHIKSKKKFKNGYPPSKPTDTTRRTGDSVAQKSSEDAQIQKDKRQELQLGTHSAIPIQRTTESLTTEPVDSNAIITSSCKDGSSGSSTQSCQTISVDPSAADAQEPRLIVEALVVRKLSLDEVFLDFEGFSLQ